MSVSAVSEATPTRSLSWFEGGGAQLFVALPQVQALVGEPGEPVAPPLPVAELLEDAAINAAGEPWRAEALLAHLTPEALTDMLHAPGSGTEVTRQVPLSAGQSVEVKVHRLPVSDDDDAAGWLFQQLEVAAF